ncbi:hypothetical protein V491_04629 [Pseudogymnoascus sp. VKM F-3775]|nr:hypothetical protein V491_04629 [Pseudogymnoascus sp. VKM F-3775]
MAEKRTAILAPATTTNQLWDDSPPTTTTKLPISVTRTTSSLLISSYKKPHTDRIAKIRVFKMAANNSYDAQASTNYKEAFALFDKRGNQRVALESLGDLLRACGQNPTLSEIRDLEKNVGSDFDFETFSKILNRPGGFRDPGEPEEYCRGFQVFDKDMTGFIGVGQLRYILTNLGEKMSDEEVDELLKAVDTSSGEINYTDLVRTVLAN